ncbi:isochorismate synthase MenF [Sporosarcina siberiensis]|uniref:isochorismate synthase n=1 Tax=Sporosarcina siberiensis TaxID=1365606 RepID=A0ABW4SGH5_9BACL
MKQKITASSTKAVEKDYLRFFTETIEIGRISPLLFFQAGEANYSNERFYWQNADNTLTLAGIGHATVLSNENADNRFEDISVRWKNLCMSLVKEEKDIEPILFGGFSFDTNHTENSEWGNFPTAFFFVPSFQLTIKNGMTSISINLVTKNENAIDEFDELRNERDRLIHFAQVNEFKSPEKPFVVSLEERGKDKYMKSITDVTNLIKKGKAEKVVIARSIKLNFDSNVQSDSALHHISNEQQESYVFGLQREGQLFFGATPERLIEVSNGQAYSACVAGSIGRGTTADEDKALGEELLDDHKNRGEHHYVVNMISNVFENNCTNISMPLKPKLMKLRDIQHLFTPIEGQLKKDTDIFSLVQALHPTPALGGVPHEISREIIRDEEKMDRGYYAGPIGWTDTKGNGEFAVAIRSALLDGDSAYLYAGGGIVADSTAEKEYEETWVKFRPVLRALGGKLNG